MIKQVGLLDKSSAPVYRAEGRIYRRQVNAQQGLKPPEWFILLTTENRPIRKKDMQYI